MSSSAASERAVVLDRDGTIVFDRGYLDDPGGLEFIPGAAEGLKWLFDHGHRLVVVTNQSGIGRGFFPLARLEAMNARLHAMVENIGARLEGIYFCPHAPEAGCGCRKPASDLMMRAAAEVGFDPAKSVVIGNKLSDIEFGHRVGAMTILISGTAPAPTSPIRPDVIAANFMDAARAVTSRPG